MTGMIRRTRHSSKSSTPLEDKKKALIEQEKQLRQKMENLNQFMAEAPKLAEAQEKKRREEMVRTTQRSTRSRNQHAVIHDRRHDHVLRANVGTVRPRRKELQAEKRDARMKFFALFILFVLVMLCLNHFR